MYPKLVRPASLFAFALLLAATTSFADAKTDQVEKLIAEHIKANRIPGLSVAIVRNGKVEFAKGYGMANLEHEVRATPETVFQIGSVTKQFTATAVMMLVEEGKVSLSDPFSKYYDDAPEAWKDVTVWHLLNHTSGIRSYTGLLTAIDKMRDPVVFGKFVDLLRPIKMDFVPGADWKYNNSGYILLGRVIEQASGKRYADFLKERIFDPLGMSATRVNRWDVLIPHRAQGYTTAPSTANAPYVDLSWPGPAGSLVSTVLDLAKWDASLYVEKLLKRSSFDQMYTPTKLTSGKEVPYGFGWSTKLVNGVRLIEHGGGIPGFNAQISRFPGEKLTVIVLANNMTGAAEKLSVAIAGVYVPKLVETR